MTGHLLGGAGGLEAGITVLAARQPAASADYEFGQCRPECRLDYVANKAIAHSFDVGLSNRLASAASTPRSSCGAGRSESTISL